MKKRFITDCVNSTQEAISNMIEQSKSITYKTFFKRVDWVEVSRMLGYHLHPSHGLTIKNDYHVSYSKSKYKGKSCYYVTWSSIEYIFI